MAIRTVGTPEALLQLISAYQGLSGRKVSPEELWREVAGFMGSSPSVFRSYRFTSIDLNRPNNQFLADLHELVKQGWVRLLDNGRMELTPVGQCLTWARELPPALQPLGEQVEASGK